MKQFYPPYKILFFILLIVAPFNGNNAKASVKHNKKSKIHHTSTNPDYEKVFPQNKVNRIDLVIKPEDWNKMMAELQKKFGEPGKGPMGGGRHPFPEGDSLFGPGKHPFPMKPNGAPFPSDEIDTIEHEGGFPGMHPGGGPEFNFSMDSLRGEMHPPMGGPMPMPNDFQPAYVPCTLTFEGKKWEAVGFRLKGNSSLMGSWTRNIKKFPFRLEFDKYADSISKIKDRRFYGFRKLSFSNNTNDMSFMREKVTNEIFREAGVKAPNSAFYRVYIDYGDGPVYFGLYTALEIVEDTMLKNLFGDESGNCYKPDGKAASLSGTFDSESFEKKTNKKDGDWSDVEKLFSVLNADLRKTDPAKWKSQLEAILDVPAFLNWLAVNSTIQNWDTYGQMAHNYYLYNNPATHKLVWIPWDNNEALSGNRGNSGSLSHAKVSAGWPLIRYLMDQPEYVAMYKSYIKSLITNVFVPERMKLKYNTYYNLISSYVTGENGEKPGYTYLSSDKDFSNAVEQLKKHVETRNQAALKFLGQ
ncbi:MAG: CotH kinase family protein [Bacteroidota bacterium]|nr:CotH kinase family protein [Bacteroidota bacterium]